MKYSAYKTYLLVLLAIVLASNAMDRVAFGVLLQSIKIDLDLSDTQLGFLTGLAFALFYSIMGIPIARWADRGNRVMIISLATMLWSAAVALCGAAGTYLQLLLVRIGVAVGEAGCVPPAHSLIADHFTRAERPRAVARYMLGAPLSVLIGYSLAGWLNQLYGWRATFVILGLPGFALAALTWLTLREPRRAASIDSARINPSRPSAHAGTWQPARLRDVCWILWRNRTFRHLLLTFSVVNFFGAGLLQWQPAFFLRSYGLQTGELGTWLGLTMGVGTLVGTYWGGEWASRQAAMRENLQLQALAAMYCVLAFVKASVYLLPSFHFAFGMLALAAAGNALTAGPMFAAVQSLVPDRMRATAIAFIYLFANLIGLGLGPLAAGMLSDAFRPVAGEDSLRYSLLALCPGYFWAAAHLWQASRTAVHDLAAVQAGVIAAASVQGIPSTGDPESRGSGTNND